MELRPMEELEREEVPPHPWEQVSLADWNDWRWQLKN